MFGIGFGELLLIVLIVLIVYGPKRLPEVARKIGGLAREAKKMTDEFRAALTEEPPREP